VAAADALADAAADAVADAAAAAAAWGQPSGRWPIGAGGLLVVAWIWKL